ncbi:unnamed protein product [Mytilus edulis]|uniref:B box-type domain-containing protein n=1 Tax=Mytilus edulis TaxID=6550 RepID=A0A8S3RIY6_MYTED|nr:unnamed protein product [Mytilus edulis]
MASIKPEEGCFTIPSKCQICDNSSILKWMCSECDLYFCANCELKFHRKNKILSGHTKIDIENCDTENITEIIRKAEVEGVTCESHSKQKCDLFCKDCHNPICKICVSMGSHKNHELVSIEDIFKEKSIERKDFQNRIESSIKHCTQTANDLEYMLEKATEKYNTTRKNILCTERQLLSQTKEYFKSQVEEIKSEWENIEESVNKEMKKVDRVKGQLDEEDEILSQDITPFEVLTRKHQTNIFYKVNDSIFHKKLQQTFYTIIEETRRVTLTNEIGFLFELNLLKGPNFKQTASFETKCKSISKLILMDNSKAVIASYKDEILQRIQFEKSELKVEQEMSNTKIFDMDIMQNGDILLSVEECELKLFKENEIAEHAPFHPFSPLKTFGVHVNRENEIIVGISAGFPNEKDEVSKPGKIVVLNSKGSIKIKHEFDQGKYRDQLCVCPTRIVTNLDNTICFIDIYKKEYYGDGYDKK